MLTTDVREVTEMLNSIEQSVNKCLSSLIWYENTLKACSDPAEYKKLYQRYTQLQTQLKEHSTNALHYINEFASKELNKVSPFKRVALMQQIKRCKKQINIILDRLGKQIF